MASFKNPKKLLVALDPEAAASLIAAASDVALIIDGQGVVRDIAFQTDELALELEGAEKWIGHPWLETVTSDSKSKITALLRGAVGNETPRWRHVNHPSSRGLDVPVLYSTAQAGADGPIVAFGRDLRAISVLQQRMVDAQQSMERDYGRLQNLETRYRLLFQMSLEAVVILDVNTRRIVDANPAARQLFGEVPDATASGAFADAFDPESAPAIEMLLARVRGAGRIDDVPLRLIDGKREVMASAALFRQDSASQFLIRLSPLDADAPSKAAMNPIQSKLLKVVESAPDGFVVTNSEGRVLTANAAFLEMAQLAAAEQAQGELLDRWVGRYGADLGVLIANLIQRGSVRLFATVLRGEYGPSVDVEISAISVRNGGQPCFGFVIRNVGRRLGSDPATSSVLTRPVEQLTELIGRVSLKDLVQDATNLIERLCIEAALEMTGDNRASAAEILGLSRQSLYQKLRRYGLGNLATETEN